ncbi:hypothetical protein H2200_005532 [Cladophialophora chaetospira]|uniref:PGG domain-containing protein n=1 Tax=Cladophialophora chaetospira TaxID=386627 RepID=A0AA39CJQ2_9EURO|nr:hypothetical protein H2200_005532 [Cladophialophora chaetospira]
MVAGEPQEMQYLHPGRLSDQSSRTAVATNHADSKPERLLQAILDELQNKKDANPDLSLITTEKRDFVNPGEASQPNPNPHSLSRPDLSRGISNSSSGSTRSQAGSGEEQFYQQLFTALVAFCVFGGSITFQCIFQTMPETTENKHITPKRARTFIALSWLIFTMDLSLSSIVLAALYVSKMRAREGEQKDSWHKRLHRYVNLVAALVLPLGAVAALIFAALAVSVLSIAVGKTALISVIVLGGAIVLWWFSFCIRHYCRRRKERKNPA